MRQVADVDAEIKWLSQDDEDGPVTGFSPSGWEAQTWVLHAMYEDPELHVGWSHDEFRRKAVEAGEIEPTYVGEVNLDEETTDTGIPLGYVRRPGASWRRLLWRDHLGWGDEEAPSYPMAPCFRWFPDSSFPASVSAPPEGSLDEESLGALLEVLAAHTADREVRCLYASLATPSWRRPELWVGPLSQVPSLLEDNGGRYGYTPNNLWPEDRSWFVWTDSDLQGTRVSGARQLVDAVKAAAGLETLDWSRPA